MNKMKNLWAPWRIGYIRKNKAKGCIFCSALKAEDKKNYIILKSKHAFSMLNIYPYNNGHVMIAPFRHLNDMAKLKREEREAIFQILIQTKKLLDKVLKPQGYNLGINLGSVAGAGVTGHLHIHLVPRWKGDTNFMPILANIKVIAQSLDQLYNLLKKNA